MERWAVAGLSVVHGALYWWAASALPWQSWSAFSIASGLAGTAHWVTAVACGLAPHLPTLREQKLEVAAACWKISGVLSLLLLALVSYQVFSGGGYITSLYGKLGQGLFAAMLAIWGLFVLVTLPFGLWGLVRTRRHPPHLFGSKPNPRQASLMLWLGAGLLGLSTLGAAVMGHTASSDRQLTSDPVELAELQPLVESVSASEKPKTKKAQKKRSKRKSQDEKTDEEADGASWSAKNRKRARRRVECEHPPTAGRQVSLIATFRGRRVRSRCFQAETVEQAVELAARHFRDKRIEAPIKVDVLRAASEFAAGPKLVETLGLRPGLDGACAGTSCLMPWQLLARGSFLQNRPLDFVRDLRFGVSEEQLRKQLSNHDDPLWRIQTLSVQITASGKLVELRRLRPVQREITRESVRDAMLAAERHVIDSQLKDGKFRYTLQPFNGKKKTKSFNLARQAGTAYALCENGRNKTSVNRVIKKALRLLKKYERQFTINDSEEGALKLIGLSKKDDATELALSSSALPWVAYLACRNRVGSQFDQSIVGLTHLILALQRDDGGFYPKYAIGSDASAAADTSAAANTTGAADTTGAAEATTSTETTAAADAGKSPSAAHPAGPVAGFEPLFAPGQAILGLLLLERLFDEQGASLPPAFRSLDRERIRQAAEKAMQYVAEQHWNHSMYPFFFIEENWHCLAAEKGLGVHEHRDYEDFCLDYMRFKSRVILTGSETPIEFLGGYGFGNVIPPHNTATAGFAEAQTSAIAILKARGESSVAEQRLLVQAFGFLLRQQWTEANCFACVPEAYGSVSEHTHSPITRIDFVQHAWAGLAGIRLIDDAILSDGSSS